jgi:hypothetical protein
MSQRAVERTLGKLVTDEQFRQRFYTEPAAASFGAGLELTPEEMDALLRLPATVLTALAALVDARICRLAVDSTGREAS